MKDLQKNIIRMLAGLCLLFAGAVIIISAKINYEYGVTIDPWIGWVMAAFGGIEIFLPLVSMFARGGYRKLGHSWALALAFVSVITAISFISSNRYKAEDATKGYSSALAADKQSLNAAQSAYIDASKAASAASAQCTAEVSKGGKGFITKACGAADRASDAQRVALTALNSARSAVEKDQQKVVSSGDGIFRDAAAFFGGTAQSWRTVVNVIMGVLFALTGFVTIYVVVHVINAHLVAPASKSAQSPKIAKPEPKPEPKAEQKPAPRPAPALKSVEAPPKG